MAEFALGNRDDAHDAVQDAMCALVERYAERPADDWPPLFYRILDRRITDQYRQRARSQRWFGLFRSGAQSQDEDAAQPDPLADAVARSDCEPEQRLLAAETISQIEAVIRALPSRQRQALLLRAWEGLDVRDTASALGCTEGTVKTHYSRALERLRSALGEDFQ